METTIKLQKGAHFLIEGYDGEIFTPENLTEEHKMIKSTVEEFVKNEFEPVADRMEHGEFELNRVLLKKLGDLGILGTHMPEEYGGMQMDPNTNSLVLEAIGPTGAFSTTIGAHTGIGMLPILYFGTEEQKQKYLPGLISGDKVASYCLTEPSSGSDALAAKTRADLNDEGTHYVINGQKMWITNAGFADVFIVFAKIDGKDFTGFILEKGMAGLTLGAEEKKLGIKGSSTRQVFFENVNVPVENLLGEKGQGHLIAFNVLNAGRYKIGPFALGGSKGLADISIKYANERIQFGRAISSFGAIKSKIAEQAVRTYAAEAAVYRTTGLINDYTEILMSQSKSYAEAELIAAEEYALESSILKIALSENVNYVADECVQIHGGMGYSEESRAARAYRDARISMIYEGTNEINRMLMLNIVFRSAMKGALDFATPAMAVQQELLTGTSSNHADLTAEARAVIGFRKSALMLVGSVGQLAMKGKINIKEEQEILMNLADILIDLYISESLMLRYNQNVSAGNGVDQKLQKAIMEVHFQSAKNRILVSAQEAVGSFVLEGKQSAYMSAITNFCDYPLQNIKTLKREIADYLIGENEYAL